MSDNFINVKKVKETAVVPFFKDNHILPYIQNPSKTPISVTNTNSVEVPTGLVLDVPAGFEVQIRPAKSLLKKGISIVGGVHSVLAGDDKEVVVYLYGLFPGTTAILPNEILFEMVITDIVHPTTDTMREAPNKLSGLIGESE